MKRKGLLSQPSPPEDLSLPTYRVSNFANPEGIPQQSPGLRGTSSPGLVALGEPTPTGLCPWVPERSHNPVGVERQFAREPRVARRLATLGWRAQSLWDCPKCQSELGNAQPRGRGKGEGEGAPYLLGSTNNEWSQIWLLRFGD